MFKKLLVTFCALLLISAPPLQALETIDTVIPQAQKVGEGRFSYMIWDIYDATLYAPKGAWTEEQPFALTLSYLMNIEGRKIADRSISEIRKQGVKDEVKLATWHAQMTKIFPNINEGSSLTGIFTPNRETIFYKNDKEIGRIKDPEFSKAFFGIWLNETTTAPALRRKLLGLV